MERTREGVDVDFDCERRAWVRVKGCGYGVRATPATGSGLDNEIDAFIWVKLP